MLKKKRFAIFSLVLVLTLSLFMGLSLISLAAEQPKIPALQTPLITTTCGQSPGALMIWVLSKQIKLPWT
ncbi:unnamed protein product, partial [marine sediment metagenome]